MPVLRSKKDRALLLSARQCYVCHANILPKQGIFFHRFEILVHYDGVCDAFVRMIHQETYQGGRRWPAAVRKRLDEYIGLPTWEVRSRVVNLLPLQKWPA